jgi:hypothetical protein
MTKKEFKEYCDFHKYTGAGRENDITALFYDWKSNEEGHGFKYCVYARTQNASRTELLNVLYDFVTGKIEDIQEYYINIFVAQTDKQRFKVPISSSGLKGFYL